MSTEIWKPISGYEDRYSVSDIGNIRRERPVRDLPSGSIVRTTKNHGYSRVMLSNGGVRSARKHILVHRIVAKEFIGPVPFGKQINHRNGIKTDNRAGNLEYVTPKENIRHAWMSGLMTARNGMMRPNSKLTFPQVEWIRRIAKHNRLSSRQLAAAFGVKSTAVLRIISGKTWRENMGHG